MLSAVTDDAIASRGAFSIERWFIMLSVGKRDVGASLVALLIERWIIMLSAITDDAIAYRGAFSIERTLNQINEKARSYPIATLRKKSIFILQLILPLQETSLLPQHPALHHLLTLQHQCRKALSACFCENCQVSLYAHRVLDISPSNK